PWSWHDEGMRIAGVESTDLFTGSTVSPGGNGAPGSGLAAVHSGRPLQVVRVTVGANDAAETGAAVRVRVMGAAAKTPKPFGMTRGDPGERRTGEVSVAVTGSPGTELPVTVIAEAGT